MTQSVDIDLPGPNATVDDVVAAFLSLSESSGDVSVPAADVAAETTLLNHLVDEVSSDDVFWDIGAHVGLFSTTTRLVADPDRIVAFEPNPYVFPVTKGILDRLSGHDRAINAAVSDSAGTRSFAADPDGGSESTFPETDSIASEYDDFETVSIESRTVPGILADGEPTPDVVKIDVEGAEDEVLRSLTPALDDIRCLFVEVHHLDRRFTEVDEFFESREMSVDVLATRHQSESVYQEFLRVGCQR